MKMKYKGMLGYGFLITLAMVSTGIVMKGWDDAWESNMPTDVYPMLLLILWLVCLGVVYLLSLSHSKRVESLLFQTEEAAFAPQLQEVSLQGKDELAALAKIINQMRADLYKGEEIRNRLVSDVAHELRTPLAILKGQLESILDGAKEMKAEQLLPLVDETSRMGKLIHDLQQLSLAESGKLQLERSWVSFDRELKEVVDFFRLEAEDKQITLHYGGEVCGEVYCDRARMKQVFINLLGNAIRYTPNGGEVRVRVANGQDSIRVDVIDNGPGIAPENLPYIFHRFYREEGSRNRKSGGMGLGLALAKDFTTLHGGTLTAASEQGKGTQFTLILPRFPTS